MKKYKCVKIHHKPNIEELILNKIYKFDYYRPGEYYFIRNVQLYEAEGFCRIKQRDIPKYFIPLFRYGK
jgi:hypothetical protein